MIKLGDEIQDTISGIKGIAVGRTTWLTGCDRITIQPKPKKGSVELPDSITIDEPLCKVITKSKPKKVNRDKGGFNIKVSKY